MRERMEGGRERERASILWFTRQMLLTDMFEPEWILETGIPFTSPMLVTGTQIFGPSPAAFPETLVGS